MLQLHVRVLTKLLRRTKDKGKTTALFLLSFRLSPSKSVLSEDKSNDNKEIIMYLESNVCVINKYFSSSRFIRATYEVFEASHLHHKISGVY